MLARTINSFLVILVLRALCELGSWCPAFAIGLKRDWPG
jgi:hypothetical protein